MVLVDGCPAAAWGAAPLAWHGDVVTGDRIVSQSCLPCEGSDHAVLEHESVVDGVIVHDALEHSVVEHPAGAPSVTEARADASGEAVVVHDPTIVVATPQKSDAPKPQVEEMPAPKTARPAAPQPQVAALEPLPDLKPATTAPEQPVPASLDLPAEPAVAAEGKKAMVDDTPLPATPGVDDLAAMPPKPAAPAEPRERNLFDEFDDEAAAGDAEASEPEMKPETSEDQPADAEPDDDQPAKPAKPAKAEAPESPAPAEDAPDAAEEPAATARFVPDEPMRLWTDSTGDHHAQGWLAELHDDGVVRILKVNGRYTTMAVADLSDADQAYVAAVATRVAGRLPTASAVNDTAGL